MGNKALLGKLALGVSLAITLFGLVSCGSPTALPTQNALDTPILVSPSPSTTPTLPATPTKPLPTAPPPTATSAIVWEVKASQIQGWPEYVYGLEWQSEVLFSGNSFEGKLIGEIRNSKVAIKLSNPENNIALSPDGAYRVLCGASSIQLYHATEPSVFAEAPISPDGCYPISWSPDGQAFAFTAQTGAIYVWETNALAPLEVGKTKLLGNSLSWSPDSSKLAVLDKVFDNNDHLATYSIVFRDGSPMYITGVVFRETPEIPPAWVNNTILRQYVNYGPGLGIVTFYEALTGRELIGDTVDFGWLPQLSPDKNWVVIDGSESNQPYVLFDFQTGEQYVLADSFEFRLEYVGWDATGQSFYAIKRQISAPKTVIPASALVRFYLNPRRWELVADNAIYASPSKNGDIFFVIHRQFSADLEPQVTASFVDLTGRSLPSGISISSAVALAVALGHYRVWWSNDEQQVVYSDLEGQLNLVNTAGVSRTLASSENSEVNLRNVDVVWSPNDSYFIFIADDGAWLVTP